MKNVKEGWVCPLCKKVYSPDKKSCKSCSKKESKEGQEDSKMFIQD